MSKRWIAATAAAFLCIFAARAAAQTIEELEKQAQAEPASLKAKEALADAYLRDCQLEKSLKLWQEVLKVQPDHKRAKLVVERLTVQALDLDTQLATLGTLIDRGVFAGTESLLDAASQRAATDPQKAHVLYLRGRLELRDIERPAQLSAPVPAEQAPSEDEETKLATRPADKRGPRIIRPVRFAPIPSPPPAPALDTSREASARSYLEGAMKLAPDSVWAAKAAMLLARLEFQQSRRDASRRLLRQVWENAKLQDAGTKEMARLRLVMIETQDLTPPQRIAALQELLAATTVPAARKAVLEELLAATFAARGRWGPEAVDYLGAMLKIPGTYEESAAVLARLSEAAAASRDPATLDRLLAVLKDLKTDDAAFARQGQFVLVEALLARAVAEETAAGVARLVGESQRALEAFGGAKADPADRARASELVGRCLLVEAQKLIALEGPARALPLLTKAKEHYLSLLPAKPDQCLDRLASVAALLEHVKEWEMAAALYREVATRYPQLPQGRDALLSVARLYETAMNDPVAALAVYAEYASRYPADLPYRQLELGARLRRLGYANLLDFQKRNALAPDGIMGPKTSARLDEVEQAFGEIASAPAEDSGVLRGRFVHPAIFQIARDLEKAGRTHDAIVAYRLFVNLFPTKTRASDAMLSIARLLRDGLLFEEALGAYAETIEDFPKGDMTAEAYVESARCLENLGRWKEAREFYDLYAKKFPKYPHAELCKQRIAILDEARQYEDFVAANPKSTKAAEAQYQLASILYEKLKDNTKAAVEFQKVADAYPKHVRAVEGLYTAGAAFLKEESFSAARKVFARIVQEYPDSRLADDAQFWIGHTYEYAARALGKLDEHRIVLKQRGQAEREHLLADLDLRRTYWPKAQAGPQVPQDVWGGEALGVLTSGSVRDRVNADLQRAIDAYRKVVGEFKTGDMAGRALLRIGTIYIEYLKDPEKGIAAYQDLLAHYGATKEAVDALYEVGAYYLKNAKFDDAVKSYQQFIYNYPNDARVEDAMLSVARCHVEKKAWEKALDAYQSLLAKFPSGKHADFAKAQVAWIRMYHF